MNTKVTLGFFFGETILEVLIQMDEGWQWWPTVEGDSTHSADRCAERKQIIDIPEALFSRYQKLKTEWYELQGVLEHMYRHQEGLRAFPGSPHFVEEKEQQNVKTQS